MTMSVTTDEDHDIEPADELESDELEPDDAVEDAGEAEETKDRRWPRRLRVGAIVLVFVAALGSSGFLGWQLWQQRQIEHASQAAQQAAVAYAGILTSIDSNKVDENFAQVLDGSTGEFKDMYSQSSVQLRQL